MICRRYDDGVSPSGSGKVGEAVAEIGESEVELLRELEGVRHRLREIDEATRHLGRGQEMALAMRREARTGRVERQVMPDRGENVVQGLVFLPGVAHAVGRDERQAEPRGERGERLVAVLLFAPAMALQLDVEPPGEEVREPLEHRPRRVRAAAVAGQRLRERSLVATGQEVQSGAELRDSPPSSPPRRLSASPAPLP